MYNYKTTKINIQERGGYSIAPNSIVKRYHFDINKMRKSSEYTSCLDFLSNSDEIKKHRDSVLGKNLGKSDLASKIESKYLIPFIERFAEKTNLQFDHSVFDKLYQKLEDFLFEKEEKTVEIYPLLYFHCEVDKIRLARGLKIRSISRREKEEILRDGAEWISIYLVSNVLHKIPSADFVIEYTWGPLSGRPDATVSQVVLALSLLKPRSRVDHYGSVNYHVTWFKRFAGTSCPPVGSVHSEPYSLTEKDVNDFLEFWNHEYLPVIKQDDHFMNMAISRFNDFRRRPNWAYGLIDLMTSLEALYLREKQELSYRLSHSCATLLGLGKTGAEKEKIRKFIMTAYRLRSNMVHGGKPKAKEIEKIDPNLKLYDFVGEISEYTRKSILKFLGINRRFELAKMKGKRKGEKGKNYENLLQTIDRAIYNEEVLRKFLNTRIL